MRGMDLAFSQRALSLVQVHTAGHFGFAGFFPSVSKTTEKRQRKQAILLRGMQAFPILLLLSDSM